jgi:CheY-like chemotaxis protein
MLKILLASQHPDRFQTLQAELSARHPVSFSQAVDGDTALERVRKGTVDLVIVDEGLGEMAGAELVRRILDINAMINTALVSSASPEDFHERTEGLGILMPLPPACGKTEAIELLACLDRLGLLATN